MSCVGIMYKTGQPISNSGLKPLRNFRVLSAGKQRDNNTNCDYLENIILHI